MFLNEEKMDSITKDNGPILDKVKYKKHLQHTIETLLGICANVILLILRAREILIPSNPSLPLQLIS